MPVQTIQYGGVSTSIPKRDILGGIKNRISLPVKKRAEVASANQSREVIQKKDDHQNDKRVAIKAANNDYKQTRFQNNGAGYNVNTKREGREQLTDQQKAAYDKHINYLRREYNDPSLSDEEKKQAEKQRQANRMREQIRQNAEKRKEEQEREKQQAKREEEAKKLKEREEYLEKHPIKRRVENFKNDAIQSTNSILNYRNELNHRPVNQEEAQHVRLSKEQKDENRKRKVQNIAALANKDFDRTMGQNSNKGYYNPVVHAATKSEVNTKAAKKIYDSQIQRRRQLDDPSFGTQEERKEKQRAIENRKYINQTTQSEREKQKAQIDNMDRRERNENDSRQSKNMATKRNIPFSSKQHNYSYDSAIRPHQYQYMVSSSYIQSHAF